MKLREKLCIGLSLAPTWLNGEGWRAPESGIEGLYSSGFALETAKKAEAAHLDFVFRPDAHVLPMAMMEQSFGYSSLDATMLMAAIARETSRIGLMTTLSASLGPPYPAARQLMSLQWLSAGRAGWNVVTAVQGEENFGQTEPASAEERYAKAAEFVAVARRLWASFPAEALLVDREAGRYADVSRIHPIEHRGRFFAVKGPLNIPSWPGPRIPLMQAGASPAGMDFAAAVADMVFGQTPDLESALKTREALSARAQAHGRAPRELRLLPGLSLYLGETREEARALFLDAHRRVDMAQRAARVKEATGLDLEGWPEDRRVTLEDLRAAGRGRFHVPALRRILEQEPIVGEFLRRPEVLASVHWQVIGTVEDAFAQIARWFEAGAIDGFIAVPGGSARSLDLTLGALVPRLAEAGLFRRAYRGTSLLEHLEED